ncbi:MAG: ParB/RepB/Spo0J family partition protein [Gemmataceae bacterium]
MDTSIDQRLKETFADAMRRPERPAVVPGVEHGPLAQRRPDKSLFLLGIDRIRPDPDQVRTENKSADDPQVKELAESIRALGLENPLTVRWIQEDDIYKLIAGERRLAAAKLAGLQEVPVKLIDADGRTALRLQLHENVHRANLTPLELGHALQKLLDEGEAPDALATLMCKSVSFVQKALTLTRQVSDESKQFIADHAERFTSLDLLYDVAQVSATEQLPLLRQVVELDLTRSEVREITAPLKKAAKTSGEARGRRPKGQPVVRAWEVPCGAKVTVAFPRGAAKADCRLALEEAIRLAKNAA